MLSGMYSRALAGTALAGTALAYALLHHLGLLPDGLGAGPEGTQWVDWIDLLVPWLVLVPAGLAMWSAGPASATPRAWAAVGAGALAYTSGHGIHLAANSVGNVAPGETAHLWDEVVGHYLWFVGVVLVAGALAMTMRGRPRPAVVVHALGLAVGVTWATNAIGGGTVVFSAVAGLAACWAGWRWRGELGVVWLVVGGSAVAWLAVAGLVGGAA